MKKSCFLLTLLCVLLAFSACKTPATPPDADSTSAQQTPPQTDPKHDPLPDTDTDTTVAPDTLPPVTDPPDSDPPVTNPPDDTDPPVTPPDIDEDAVHLTLQDGVVEWTARSESGTMLNLVALCEGSMNADGTMLISVNLFLEHYQIYLGPRSSCRLSIGGNTQIFGTEQIVFEEGKLTKTYLTSLEVEVDPDESFDIQAMLAFNGVYGGVELDLLTISERYQIVK